MSKTVRKILQRLRPREGRAEAADLLEVGDAELLERQQLERKQRLARRKTQGQQIAKIDREDELRPHIPYLVEMRLEAVGNTPLRDAFGMLQTRFGRHVTTEAPDTYVQSPVPDTRKAIFEAIADVSGQLASHRAQDDQVNRRALGNPDVLARKQLILAALRDASIRRYTSTELSAALALSFGLDGYQREPNGAIRHEGGRPVLSEFVNHLNAANRLGSNVFDGNTLTHAEVARLLIPGTQTGLLEGVHDFLLSRNQGKKVFTSVELGRILGIEDEAIDRYNDGNAPATSDERKCISRALSKWMTTALGTLEAMGLVKKLPMHPRGSSVRWVHTEHLEGIYFPPTDSTDYMILSRLYVDGPKERTSFSRPFQIKGENFGNPVSSLSEGGVQRAVNRMATDRLVRKYKVGHTTMVDLTDEGRSIMRDQAMEDRLASLDGRCPHLLESTRQALMGSYTLGLSEPEHKRILASVEAIAILRRLEQDQHRFRRGELLDAPEDLLTHKHWNQMAARIAREVSPGVEDDPRAYYLLQRRIYSIERGQRPWTNVGPANLKDAYLPAMAAMEADGLLESGTSQWFEQNIVSPTNH